jgi:hypothetical protein
VDQKTHVGQHGFSSSTAMEFQEIAASRSPQQPSRRPVQRPTRADSEMIDHHRE